MSGPIWMENTTWRETGRTVKVGPFDGRLMVFLVLLIMFPNLYLLGLCVLAIIFFYILEYVGYSLPNAWRKISVVLSGTKKMGVHYWRRSRFR
jgi:hypothetical protein